mgnify:CR=1 FL=1
MKKFTEWLKSKNLDLFNEQDPVVTPNQQSKYGQFRTASRMSEPTQAELETLAKDPRYLKTPSNSRQSFPMNLAVGNRSQDINVGPYKKPEPKTTPNKEQLSLMVPNFTGPSTSSLVKSMTPQQNDTFIAKK